MTIETKSDNESIRTFWFFDQKPPPLKDIGGRPRLDFKRSAEICPELTSRTKVIRGRVKDLRDKFRKTGEYVQKKFRNANIVGGVTTLGLILIFTSIVVTKDGANLIPLLGLLATVVALVFGVVYVMGRDRQYNALVSARWAIDGLLTKIDNHILQICFEVGEDRALPPERRAELITTTEKWSVELEEILQLYGAQTGAALRPITMSSKNFGSNN